MSDPGLPSREDIMAFLHEHVFDPVLFVFVVRKQTI